MVLELRKVIQAKIVPNSYLIEVSMTSPAANECSVLVNAVVDAYIESNNEWSDGMTRMQIKNLEVYLGDLKSQSDEYERRWRDLVKPDDESDVARKGLINANHAPKIEEKLIDCDLERVVLQARLEALQARKSPKDGETIEILLADLHANELMMTALKAKLGPPATNPQARAEQGPRNQAHRGTP